MTKKQEGPKYDASKQAKGEAPKPEAPKIPGKGGYAASIASQRVEKKIGELRSEIDTLETTLGKGSVAFDQVGSFVEQSKQDPEEKKKRNYTVSGEVEGQIGTANAKKLREVAGVFKERDDLVRQVKAIEYAQKVEDFAQKKIAELNRSPYKKLEAARTDNEAYKALIAECHYVPEDQPDAKPVPTRAVDWVNQQLAEANAVYSLENDIEIQIKRVHDLGNPPKPEEKAKEGNGENVKKEEGKDDKKSGRGKSKKK